MKDPPKEFPVGKMCNVLKVGGSGFRAWRKHPPSKRDNENRMLSRETRRIHPMSRVSYGSPRITGELGAHGLKVSRPRAARPMGENGVRAVHAKKFVATTGSRHGYRVAQTDRTGTSPPWTAGI